MPEEGSRAVLDLDADDASHAAQMLLQLGALVDPDDPDGMKDIFGVLHPAVTASALSRDQFRMLDPLYSYSDRDRARVAERLRRISATIEGQLPQSAPEVIHRKRLPS